MTKLGKYLRTQRAQTAMELAVFGAILIFVIGAIVRQALSAGYMQNQQLRAMRQAMSTSYRYSTGLLGGGGAAGNASHQTAQILFIEDRLTAESAKYGAIDRTPFVVGASGTYSRNLFLPVDANEDYNLPIYDIFINGKHFPFTTAAFRTVELARPCSGVALADCAAYPQCNGSCDLGSIQFYPGNLSCRNMNPCPAACGGDCSGASAQVYPVEWQDNCVERTTMTTTRCSDSCNPVFCNLPGDCNAGSPKTWLMLAATEFIGCAKLYDVIYNHPSYLEWCDDEPGGTACPVPGDPAYNLTADERFDLDRSGPPPTNPPDVLAGPDRTSFSWQWFLVAGFDGKYDDLLLPRVGFFVGPPPATRYRNKLLIGGAGIVLEPDSCKKNCKSSQHTVIDVDGDFKRERIMVNTKEGHVDTATGIIKEFVVMDMQQGDLDFSRGDSDPGPEPGLQKDTRMYSFVRDSGNDGTYLLIEEGKLYLTDGDASQYIRTTQKKDQIDLIERTLQLSNDTERFCDSGGNVVTRYVDNDPLNSEIWTTALPNPVEACSSDCHSGPNVVKTCMDEDPAGDGTQPPVIYVRSRVADRRGRKWITSTEADDSVTFTLPAGP